MDISLLSVVSFDYQILLWFHQLAEAAGSFFTPFFKIITSFGNHGLGFIILSLILLLFKKTRRLGIMVIISMAIGYLFSNLLIKNLVRRPRPYTVEGSDFIDWWKLTGSLTDSEYSFPSGHATVSAAFSICFVWHYGFKKGWPMILVPLLIGITRLYFVVHYPTDILAGWTIGTLASLGAFYLVRLLDRLSWMPKVYGWWGIEDLFKKKQPAAAEGAEEPQPEENGKDNPSQPK